MCLCSAGNEGGATLPKAKKYRQNAVKRVSWKQTAYFGSAAHRKCRHSVINAAGIQAYIFIFAPSQKL